MDLETLRRVSAAMACMLDGLISIGTEEAVAVRRKVKEMLNYALQKQGYKRIYSGSKGEGYNFSTSDEDLMFVCRHTLVLDSTQDIDIVDGPYKTKLLMRRENCNPGFVILQLLNRTRDPLIRNSIVKYDDIRVVSSLLYRDTCNDLCPTGVTGHGPCSSGTFKGIEFDFAYCFECKLWPTDAYEFIHRSRRYQWPSKQLLDEMIERGCNLVAIGDKDSDISHIQWRLSFSVSEKALMHSLNHTQFKVYGLLKIFLKQVIDKEERVKGVLCSYFLKTALFYSIESTPASFWRDDLIILCFWLCFNKLYKWVIQGYCPNYFVPQNNMFRNKICGETQRSIASVLYKYKCVGWTCVCQCEDFKVLQEICKNPNLFCNFIPDDIALKVKTALEYLGTNTTAGCITCQCNLVKHMLRQFLKLLAYSRSIEEEYISTNFVGSFFVKIGQNFFRKLYNQVYNEVDHVGNRNSYALAKQSEIYFLKCTGADISRGLLTQATSYYRTGQYNKAIRACKTVLSKLKPYYVIWPIPSTKFLEHIKRYTRSRGPELNLRDIMKRMMAMSVKISASSKYMYPPELKDDIEAELEKSWDFNIPPLPYLAFLLFLCHHKLGDIDESFSALHDLKTLVNDETYKHHYIEYNMLATCLEKLGDTQGAVDACFQSIKQKPKKNGACRLIDKIISCS